MGATVCDAVEADPELELVAAVDEGDDLDAVRAAGAEVVVDFTVAEAARDFLAQRRIADRAGDWDVAAAVPGTARAAAVASLVLWMLIIVAGRWIAYHV